MTAVDRSGDPDKLVDIDEGRRRARLRQPAHKERVHRNPVQLTMSQGFTVKQSLEFGLLTFLEYIFLRSWRVLTFDAPRLLTSDSPFGYWAPPGADKGPVGVGNAPALFFPIDRFTALSMLKRPTPEGVIQSGSRRADQINYAVAKTAEKWIRHHPDDDPIAGVTLPPLEQIKEEMVAPYIDADGNLRERYRVTYS